MQGDESLITNRSPAVGQVHGIRSKTPSPSKKHKLRSKVRRIEKNIQWNDDIMLSLFKAVVAKQPYLKLANGDKNKSWTEVKDIWFQQEVMAEYSEHGNSETMLRNMRVDI